MDVFQLQIDLDEELVKEYYERNERKKADEKWIKTNRGKVIKALKRIGREKVDVGSFRVSVIEPDNSKFDEEKVLEFLKTKGLYEQATKRVLDDDALGVLIDKGVIDVEELKEAAWVEAKGHPRVTIKLLG